MKNRIVVLISAVWLVLSMTAYSQDEKVAPNSEQNQKVEAPQAPKRLYAALFVIDSMDCASEKQLDTFRSIVSSRMAQTGFSVINQDVVIEALRKKGLSLSPDTLGAITREGTALSLSELMGADYLIIARLLGYQTQRKSYSRGQIATVVIKQASSIAANQALKSTGNDVAQLIGGLAIYAAQTTINIADTRSWTLLPHDFQVCRVPTPSDGVLHIAETRGYQASTLTLPNPKGHNLVYVKSVVPGKRMIIWSRKLP